MQPEGFISFFRHSMNIEITPKLKSSNKNALEPHKMLKISIQRPHLSIELFFKIKMISLTKPDKRILWT